MDLTDYVRFLRKRWILIVAFTLAGIGGGAVVTLVTTPEYEASTLVYVSVQSSGAAGELAQGNAFVQQQVKSYAEAASTPLVLDPVIDRLGLDETPAELAETVTANAPLDTVNIEITAVRPSAEEAAEIANAVTASFRQVISEINQPANGDPSPITVALLRPATVPERPVSPDLRVNLLLGGLIGLVVGLAVAVLIELLDTRVHGERDVRRLTSAPILGGISFDRNVEQRPLIVQDEPASPRAEAYRALRTNLRFLEIEGGPHSFVVTSSVDREGKTTTVANLGLAMADTGARVLLIDADLRRPALAGLLGLEGAVGLSDVLIGRVSLRIALQSWGRKGLVVLPSGAVPPNPSELLGSRAMASLLAEMEAEFDLVIIDVPPLLPVTDAAVLSTRTRGALLVVSAGRARRADVARALETLENVGARISGVILTMLPAKGPDAYGYAEGYSAGYRTEGAAAPTGAEVRPPALGLDRFP